MAYKNFIISTDGNGKGYFQFDVKDQDWGRYLIRVLDPTDGHATSTTVNIDWPIWSGKQEQQMLQQLICWFFNR